MEQRRFRSKAVAIPAVTFLAAGVLVACGGNKERRTCVDANNRVIDERSCRTSGGAGRYYYYRGGTPGLGSTAPDGGSYTKGASTKVGRGGFGGKSSGG